MLEISKLPLSVNEICAEDVLQNLQNLSNLQCICAEELDHLLLYIYAAIDKELTIPVAEVTYSSLSQYNQVLLNIAFRTYYNLLRKYNRKDEHFKSFIEKEAEANDRYFITLYCVLLTEPNQCNLNMENISKMCLKSLRATIDNNEPPVLIILKTLNLLHRKCPQLEFEDFGLTLDHVYSCLQSPQIGMREEILIFLNNVCAKDKQLAFKFFLHVLHYWPWTNRNKLYVLSCILKSYSLEFLLDSAYSTDLLFKGLRLTLSYKYLLASSQYLVKSLSAQRSKCLLKLCAEILECGNQFEIQNFYDQWFLRIDDKEELFEMIKHIETFSNLFHKDDSEDNEKLNHRSVLVFCMFSKYFLQFSPQIFSNLSEKLLRHCFRLQQLETQLLAFNFCVDSINKLPFNVALEFIAVFLQHHSTVESSKFRNTVLRKLTIVINYIAKVFHRLSSGAVINSPSASSDRQTILKFFQSIHKLVLNGIANHDVYQPLILALKILELLLKSLYAKIVLKNAKNCALTQNQQLGKFLRQQQLFDKDQIFNGLLKLLSDPMGFDDAQDIASSLLACINDDDDDCPCTGLKSITDLCSSSCSHTHIDIAKLSFLYARVFIQSCKNETDIQELYNSHWIQLNAKLQTWKMDPLWTCQAGDGHLFSHMDVINEIMQSKPELISEEKLIENLLIIEEIENLVLKMLNSAANGNNGRPELAASFQDIDESLQILVEQSNWKSKNHEEARKYLLMTFWLTLRACTALAATMGILLIESPLRDFVIAANKKSYLQRFLETCSMVLTKCRHKGAIEFAGLCIGKLTKSISTHFPAESLECELLHDCLYHLYDLNEAAAVSTTRRGAGFSIMFLHIIKNEAKPTRPILKRALENLIKKLKSSGENVVPKMNDAHDVMITANYDRSDALALHYLCVLARDTVLREAMQVYYSEILMIAVKQIDNPEWTVCNGALQLFGALIPKIVGQRRQTAEFEEQQIDWEPCEITLSEIQRKLPKVCNYILQYCSSPLASTKTVILFLGFLQNIEHLEKETEASTFTPNDFRQLMWSLLRHPCEKVRNLAAVCFVRFHEFRCDLPNVLRKISKIIFTIKDENFFEGLIFTLDQGILKLRHESMYIIHKSNSQSYIDGFISELKNNMELNFQLNRRYKLYTLFKLKNLLQLLKFDKDCHIIKQLECCRASAIGNSQMIGGDLWLQ